MRVSDMRDDDIVIRWSFTYNGGYRAGDVRIPRADWNAMGAEVRALEARAAVGDAVIRALDVDWTVKPGLTTEQVEAKLAEVMALPAVIEGARS